MQLPRSISTCFDKNLVFIKNMGKRIHWSKCEWKNIKAGPIFYTLCSSLSLFNHKFQSQKVPWVPDQTKSLVQPPIKWNIQRKFTTWSIFHHNPLLVCKLKSVDHKYLSICPRIKASWLDSKAWIGFKNDHMNNHWARVIKTVCLNFYYLTTGAKKMTLVRHIFVNPY